MRRLGFLHFAFTVAASVGAGSSVLVDCATADERRDSKAIALVQPLISSPLMNGGLTGSVASVSPNTHSSLLVPTDSVRGWKHVFGLLEREGLDRTTLLRIFSDSRLPERDILYFSLNPKESAYNYRKLNTARNRQNAIRFYREHQAAFREAEKRFSVPGTVILSILQVETACGRNTGRSRVLPALLRLASAADPENIEKNYAALTARDKSVRREAVEKRAQWLEETFFPHVVGTIKLANLMGVHPLDLRGSFSGAVGYPQFLPGHHFEYGVDGNRDGRVDLFRAEDAILSVGNYLNSHGWSSLTLPPAAQRDVIWHYNRSVPYVDTVLAMSRDIKRDLSGPPARITKAPTKRASRVTGSKKAAKSRRGSR